MTDNEEQNGDCMKSIPNKDIKSDDVGSRPTTDVNKDDNMAILHKNNGHVGVDMTRTPSKHGHKIDSTISMTVNIGHKSDDKATMPHNSDTNKLYKVHSHLRFIFSKSKKRIYSFILGTSNKFVYSKKNFLDKTNV